MDMNDPPFAHLLPQIRALADAPAEMRIRRIRTDRWIGYARAEAALAAMEDLLTFPKRMRMPNLLLVGPSNNGKTMIVEKFRREHVRVAEADVREGAITVPVLKVQMPPAPDERRVFSGVGVGRRPPAACYGGFGWQRKRATSVTAGNRAAGPGYVRGRHNLVGCARQQRPLPNP